MSIWEPDPKTGESREVGLSPGQTGGQVGGTWIERPLGSDITKPYRPDEEQSRIYVDPRTGQRYTVLPTGERLYTERAGINPATGQRFTELPSGERRYYSPSQDIQQRSAEQARISAIASKEVRGRQTETPFKQPLQRIERPIVYPDQELYTRLQRINPFFEGYQRIQEAQRPTYDVQYGKQVIRHPLTSLSKLPGGEKPEAGHLYKQDILGTTKDFGMSPYTGKKTKGELSPTEAKLDQVTAMLIYGSFLAPGYVSSASRLVRDAELGRFFPAISTGKPKGILFEIKDVYTIPGEKPQIPGLVPKERIPIPERIVTFARETKGGLTDIYIRPPAKTAEEWMAQIEGHAKYVKTQYGSYLTIQPTGLRTEQISRRMLLTQPETISKKQMLDFLERPIKDADTLKKYLTPVFERMGTNVASLGSKDFSIVFRPKSEFPVGMAASFNTKTKTIELLEGITGKKALYYLSHEVGHGVTRLGTTGQFLSEASAKAFEQRFIKIFNVIYKTSLPSNKASFGIILEGGDIPLTYRMGTYAGNLKALGKILRPEFKMPFESLVLKTKNIFGAYAEKIPIRIEKRLKISPAELQLSQIERKLGLPRRTWDIDIEKSTSRSRTGETIYDIWGGYVKGAPERRAIPGTKEYLQLTERRQPELILRTKRQVPEDFISAFDTRQQELAHATRKALSPEQFVRTITKTATAIRTGAAIGAIPGTKRKVAVAERTKTTLAPIYMKGEQRSYQDILGEDTELRLFKQPANGSNINKVRAIFGTKIHPSSRPGRTPARYYIPQEPAQ